VGEPVAIWTNRTKKLDAVIDMPRTDRGEGDTGVFELGGGDVLEFVR
jgi:hypothetical protein